MGNAQRGTTANDVPFLALPPEWAKEARGLVGLWHGADPPRTEEALAAAVPMRDALVWRVFLGMPGHGLRSPAGGVDEIMRLSSVHRAPAFAESGAAILLGVGAQDPYPTS
jgi:hypothetical protein